MKLITKTLFLLLLCLLHNTQIFAQKEVAVIQQKLRKTNATQIFMVGDSTKSNFSLLLHDKDSLYGYLLDNQYKVIKKVSIENTIYGHINSLGELVASQYEGNGVYSMLFYQSSEEEFIWIAANYIKGTLSYTATFRYHYDKLKQIYIGIVTYKNSHYAITINYDKTNFYAHKISRTHETEVIAFQPLDKAYDKIFEKRRGVGQKTTINHNLPINLHIASKPNKLYFIDNKIYLTADREAGYDFGDDYTSLAIHYEFVMDLETKKVEVIKKSLSDMNTKTTGINSLIYKENLYLVGVTKEAFEFNIIALKDMKLLKKYTFNETDVQISFANSPMVKDNNETDTDLKDLKTTEKFLNKISGNIVIAVNQISANQTELKIGYYQEDTGGGGYTGGGAVIGGYNGVGGMSMPTYYSFGGGGKSFCGYFKTHLDLNTGEYIKRDNNTTVFSKYAAFKDKLENTKVYGNNGAMVKIKPTAILGYFINNKLLYGYYNSLNETYRLVEFTDGDE